MGKTSIEWTATVQPDGTVLPGYTFNPWWGCQRVSPGCEHCYAESFAKRYGHQVWGPASTTERRFFGEAHWAEPLKWDRQAAKDGVRRRVFCASMADVFEDNEAVSRERNRLWGLISTTPHLDWLLLTKRPENIAGNLPWDWEGGWPNVWLGTTVESQEYAYKRLGWLLDVPAVVHFASCEPLLGPLDLTRIVVVPAEPPYGPEVSFNALTGAVAGPDDLMPRHLSWVIAGGESGGHARPMHPDWARSLRDQCQAAGVAFHFKQWGEWAPTDWRDLTATQGMRSDTGHITTLARGGERTQPADPVWSAIKRVGKHNAGRLLDGVEHNAFPEPAPAVPEGARP